MAPAALKDEDNDDDEKDQGDQEVGGSNPAADGAVSGVDGALGEEEAEVDADLEDRDLDAAVEDVGFAGVTRARRGRMGARAAGEVRWCGGYVGGVCGVRVGG